MNEAFRAMQIADGVYWVGAIDWDVRHFHGYLTSRGTTYNAYLVLAEKPVLIDTVKAPFFDEMMGRIASVIEPEKIEYLVSNHSEMDHTGCLLRTIDAIRPKQIYASRMGQKALAAHFHTDPQSIAVVGDGDSLDLGDMSLAFVETRMCHWPDSMVSYLREREILFSQDAFGMHLASYERFADEIDRSVLDYESAKYYANILLHLSPFIDKTLNKMNGLNLPMQMVAPDHGPIWRTGDGIQRIIGNYARWSAQKCSKKAVVVYDSMWDSTARMARVIADGLAGGGVSVKLLNMGLSHRSDVVTELLDAGALVVGSATMNNNILPTMADVMTYIKGLKPRNLIAASFGSFGWSGEAPQQLHSALSDLGLHVVADPLRINYVPDAEALSQCRDLGLKVAAATVALCEGKSLPSREPVPVAGSAPARPCTIDINNGHRTLDVMSGKTLFDTLRENDINLPTICGGEGICGCCRVKMTEGCGRANAAEKGHLNEEQVAAGIRLACQVPVDGDMAVWVPEETLEAKPFRGRLEAVTDLTHDIKLFRIALTEPHGITFAPGEYVKLDVPETVDPTMASRAFSIASAPSDKGHIELLVRLNPNGICTNWMFRRLKVGDDIGFSGPYGDFGLSDSDAEMVWVAGGSGLSCFRSLLQQMIEGDINRKCTLFFGAVAKRDLYLVDELRQAAREHDWFTYIPALSAPAEGDDWSGETGLITEVLDRHLADVEGVEAYLCGSPGMLRAAMGVLRDKGIPPERTFCDEFTPIALASK